MGMREKIGVPGTAIATGTGPVTGGRNSFVTMKAEDVESAVTTGMTPNNTADKHSFTVCIG